MRLAGAAGVVGVLLGAVGSAGVGHILDLPGTDAGASEITRFVTEHRTAGLVSMLLNTGAVTLWLVFGAGVWLRLRAAGGAAENFASACFAFATVSFTTLILAGFVPFMLLVYRANAVTDPRLLFDATFGLLAMSAAPTVVALTSYAVAVFRFEIMPRWTAWLAVVGAAAHLVLLGSFVVGHGFFSLHGQVISAIPATLFAWILGTGIAMLRAERRPSVRRLQ